MQSHSEMVSVLLYYNCRNQVKDAAETAGPIDETINVHTTFYSLTVQRKRMLSNHLRLHGDTTVVT